MSKNEALKIAIEALEYHTEQTRPIQRTLDALAVCKAALSEEAQTVEQDNEPFGIWHVGETEDESDFFLYKDSGDVWEEGDIYLYTSPPKIKWVGLSDAEVQTVFELGHHTYKEFAKAIEAKLKELNT